MHVHCTHIHLCSHVIIVWDCFGTHNHYFYNSWYNVSELSHEYTLFQNSMTTDVHNPFASKNASRDHSNRICTAINATHLITPNVGLSHDKFGLAIIVWLSLHIHIVHVLFYFLPSLEALFLLVLNQNPHWLVWYEAQPLSFHLLIPFASHICPFLWTTCMKSRITTKKNHLHPLHSQTRAEHLV